MAAFLTPHFQLCNTSVVQVFIHIWADLNLVFASKIFRCQRMNFEYLKITKTVNWTMKQVCVNYNRYLIVFRETIIISTEKQTKLKYTKRRSVLLVVLYLQADHKLLPLQCVG
jgi:chorismate mutase